MCHEVGLGLAGGENNDRWRPTSGGPSVSVVPHLWEIDCAVSLTVNLRLSCSEG